MPRFGVILDGGISPDLVAEATERNDYTVHLKYVRLIARLSKNLSTKNSLEPAIGQCELAQLAPKLKLIQRTNAMVEEQVRCIEEDGEYAEACVAWLPAQVYYNLYHLLSILEYMLHGDKVLLRMGHDKCLDAFATHIATGAITFTCPLFNRVSDRTILNFKSKSGEVLTNDIPDDRLYSLLMKKIAEDRLKDFKIRHRLNLRKAAGKKSYEAQAKKLNISIADLFYSMRLRTNYRDLSFLDDVGQNRTRTYFLQYHEAANNFYECLNDLKNDIIAKIT